VSETALVSIITPVLNGERYIRQTLESVALQEHPRIEHIVVDGGSSDSTADIVREYAPRSQLVRRPGSNQAEAVNEGIRLAKGSLIGWINADDFYFDRGVITAITDSFRSHANARVVYGDCVYIDAMGRITDIRVTPSFNRERLARYSYLPQPAVFILSDLARSVPINPEYEFVMDSEWFLRLATRCDFQHIQRFVAVFRQHPGQKMHRLGSAIYLAETGTLRRQNRGTTLRRARALDMMTNLRARIAGRLWRLRNGPSAFDDMRRVLSTEGKSTPCV
jgi:glycosyltransferase involved in cell wall biosynthesis